MRSPSRGRRRLRPEPGRGPRTPAGCGRYAHTPPRTSRHARAIDPAGKLGTAAAVSAVVLGGQVSETGMHTGALQQVLTTQSEPAGQVPVGQAVSPAHAVLPGTQKPPPAASVVQTQSGFV